MVGTSRKRKKIDSKIKECFMENEKLGKGKKEGRIVKGQERSLKNASKERGRFERRWIDGVKKKRTIREG